MALGAYWQATLKYKRDEDLPPLHAQIGAFANSLAAAESTALVHFMLYLEHCGVRCLPRKQNTERED